MSKKSQFWYIDFFVAVAIFVFGLLTFIFYTSTTINSESNTFNYDSSSKVSELILSSGIPLDWTTDNFEIPGIIANDKIDTLKLNSLYESNYDYIRNKLGVNGQISLYITSLNSGDAISISKNCGININSTIDDEKLLYYSRVSRPTTLLFEEKYELSNKTDFINSIDSANIVVLDNPHLEDFSVLELEKIQKFAYDGNFVFISGIVNADIFEHNFEYLEDSGLITSNYFNKTFLGNVTQKITISNEALKNIDDKSTKEYRYLINSNVSNIDTLAIGSLGSTILKIKYGLGEVYYFNDFEQMEIESEIKKIIQSKDIESCTIIPNTEYKRISQTVRISRLNNNFVKLIIQVFE
ncbi:hypothetical protein JXM83_03545 [Candidatus Woesearchaeota archaeon]|nr:hypothetical protein [Candidatus Woesearchaeota archaeon]